MAVQYYVACSLDGYIADRDGKLDWLRHFGMTEFEDHYEAFLANVGALVMGAPTYEFVLAEGEDAWPYADLPTWVVTHRDLPRVPGADLRFASGDIGPIVQDAKDAAGERNVWVVGGGEVAAQVAEIELLDELHLTIMPVVLGGGTPVLPITAPQRPLALLGSTQFPSGAMEHVYTFHAAG